MRFPFISINAPYPLKITKRNNNNNKNDDDSNIDNDNDNDSNNIVDTVNDADDFSTGNNNNNNNCNQKINIKNNIKNTFDVTENDIPEGIISKEEKSYKYKNNTFKNSQDSLQSDLFASNDNMSSCQSQIPRTIILIDNLINQSNFLVIPDLNYDYINLDPEYSNNIVNNDNLNYIYNKNNNLIINNNKIYQSFSSINSSLDDLIHHSSSPPISRSNTPLKNHNDPKNFNLFGSILSTDLEESNKRRKIIDNLQMFNSNSYLNLNLSLNLSFDNINFPFFDNNCFKMKLKLSSFTNNRIELIKNLSLKENIRMDQVDSFLKLFQFQNFDINFDILKLIFNLNDNLIVINQSKSYSSWYLEINSNNNLIDDGNYKEINKTNSLTSFQFYKNFIVDFTLLLSLINSIKLYMINDSSMTNTNSTTTSERDILKNFYSLLNRNKINTIRSTCNFFHFDHNLINTMAFLLWKTTDPEISEQFKNLPKH